jgi:hypothetical protein
MCISDYNLHAFDQGTGLQYFLPNKGGSGRHISHFTHVVVKFGESGQVIELFGKLFGSLHSAVLMAAMSNAYFQTTTCSSRVVIL